MHAAPAGWTVLCFSSVDWHSHRQRPHWVTAALAKRGARVLYVDNIGIRLPRLGDARRVWRRLAPRVAVPGPGPPELHGIERRRPVVLPLQQFRPVRWLGLQTLLRRLRPYVASARPLVVWSYLPMPVIADLAEALHADLLIYDWCDDMSERTLTRSARHRQRIAWWEDGMAARADLVVAASGELLRRRAAGHPRAHVVAHGVNPDAGLGIPLPGLVATAPHPRIGYVGSISAWTDLELVASVARARPQWSIILVGPAEIRLGALRRLPNLVLTGERPHHEIPGIVAAFDAAIIPYRLNGATRSASPIKLHEYLAQGVPVVSVDIPGIRDAGSNVEVAHDAAGFIRALDRALAPGRRQQPTGGVTWEDRVEEIVRMADHALRERGARHPA